MNNSELSNEFNKIKELVMNSKDKNYDNYIKLDFYKYYKQATEGDCNTEKPWFCDQYNLIKWNAWNTLKGMSKEEAMENYITLYNDVDKID